MTTQVVRAIGRAVGGDDLSRAEMAEVIGAIMDGQVTAAQIGGLLVALRMKGEAIDELVGAASAMRTRALPITCPRLEHSIDTCGTGGDAAGTVNVSTLAAILIAACGGMVAKHGNRALSSRCGSADVLETLGVAVDAEPAVVERCLAVAGIGFMFAPRFHAATRHVSGPRRELGTRTIFNLLGPLTNPAQVRHQVVGVFDRRWCEPVAAALGALGVRRAAVVHGAGSPRVETSGPSSTTGIDEIAVRGETHVAMWNDGIVETFQLSPKSFGIHDADPGGLVGGDAAHNANVLRAVLAGRHVDRGEAHEAVLHAAAMAAALGLELLEPGEVDLGRLPDQYVRASTVARDGAARLVLYRFVEASRATANEDLSALATKTAAEFKGVE